jgi:hypothetical protein
VTAERKGITGNSREWAISTFTSGKTRVEARTKEGTVWDWVELTFMAVPHDTPAGATVSPEVKAEVFDAVRRGRIRNASGALLAIERSGKFTERGRDLVLADAMFPVLASLSRGGALSVMSLMRFGHGPHGRPKTDDLAVGWAMDIDAYDGFKINLINGDNVEDTIAGVVKVIDNLPPGEYALGLTRPSPFPSGPPMPGKDVFLPCNPKVVWPMYTPGAPRGNPTPQFVNPDAAAAVNTALLRNPRAKMNRMFQDGPDHLHLEVISATSE